MSHRRVRVFSIPEGKINKDEVVELVHAACDYLGLPESVSIDVRYTYRDMGDVEADVWRSMKNPLHFSVFIEAQYAVCRTRYQQLTTIAHEIVHVKQFYRGELATDDESGFFMWCGENIISYDDYAKIETFEDETYQNLPFEKEAITGANVIMRRIKASRRK